MQSDTVGTLYFTSFLNICCTSLQNPVWNIGARKMELDLPGHADEVYAVDWSPDGQKVVSGGKDKILKL